MNKRFALSSILTDLSIAVIPPAALLVIHFMRMVLLPDAYEFDVAAHAGGGLSIAWMAMIIWLRWTKRKWIPSDVPGWLRTLTVWGTVGLFGIFWEFMEWTGDYFFHMTMQPSLNDTMNDLFMDLLGGITFLFLFYLWQKRRRK